MEIKNKERNTWGEKMPIKVPMVEIKKGNEEYKLKKSLEPEEKIPVKIFKQSYLESKVDSILEPIGLVTAIEYEYGETTFEEKDFEKATKKLLDKASELNASHIFGVDYKIIAVSWTKILCYGDAYKLK